MNKPPVAFGYRIYTNADWLTNADRLTFAGATYRYEQPLSMGPDEMGVLVFDKQGSPAAVGIYDRDGNLKRQTKLIPPA